MFNQLSGEIIGRTNWTFSGVIPRRIFGLHMKSFVISVVVLGWIYGEIHVKIHKEISRKKLGGFFSGFWKTRARFSGAGEEKQFLAKIWAKWFE